MNQISGLWKKKKPKDRDNNLLHLLHCPDSKAKFVCCFLGQISVLFTNREQGSRILIQKLLGVPTLTYPSPSVTLFLDLLQKQVLHGRLLRDVGWDLPLTVHSSHVGPMADQVPAARTPRPARHTSCAWLQSNDTGNQTAPQSICLSHASSITKWGPYS